MKVIQRNLRSAIIKMKSPKGEPTASNLTEEEYFLENLNQDQVNMLDFCSLRAIEWKVF